MEVVKVNKPTKDKLAQLARDENRSESEVVERLVKTYRFDRAFAKVETAVTKKFNELGINTIDEMEEYLG